jgi:hypothetical protein
VHSNGRVDALGSLLQSHNKYILMMSIFLKNGRSSGTELSFHGESQRHAYLHNDLYYDQICTLCVIDRLYSHFLLLQLLVHLL